jgi:hypothetical protein
MCVLMFGLLRYLKFVGALRARRLDAVLIEKSRIAPALPLSPFSRLPLSSRD